MRSIIVFGCGFVGRKAYEKLNEEYSIIAFSDNDQEKWGKEYCGVRIISPEEISSFDATVVIAVSGNIDKLAEQLRSLGAGSIVLFRLYYGSDLKEEKYVILDCNKTEPFYKYKENPWIKDRTDIIPRSKKEAKEDQKKILMIAYYFPPEAGGTEQRSLKFAKYLREFGYSVTVCSIGYFEYFDKKNPDLLNEIPDVEIVRVMDHPRIWQDLSEEEEGEIFELYRGIFGSMVWFDPYKSDISDSGKKLIPEDSIIWVNYCLKELDKLIDITGFDIVYTSSSPYSAAVLGYYLKKAYQLKWVADLRDPWCENEFRNKTWYSEARKYTFKYEYEMEKRILELADKIVIAAEYNIKDFVKFGSDQRVVSITNGYDEEEYKEIEPERFEKFTIAYIGSFYGNMFLAKPGNWSRVISDMISSDVIDKDQIQWIFYGKIDGKAVDEIRENDKYGIFHFYETVPHKKALELMTGANLLVVVGDYGEGANACWASKLFEYFRTGVPILSFSSPYGVQHDALIELDQGTTVEPDDADKMKAFISELYRDWKAGTPKKRGDSEKVKVYERRNLTKKLAEVFDTLS